jgi:WD40 repeat protein
LSLDVGENTASISDIAAARQQAIFYLKTKSRIHVGGGQLAWTGDGSVILRAVLVDTLTMLQSWDVDTGNLVHETDTNPIFSITYSPDHLKLLLSGFLTGMYIADTKSFAPLITYEQVPTSIVSKWSQDSRLIVGYGDEYPIGWTGFVGLWDAATGKLINRFTMHSHVNFAILSPNKNTFSQ